MQITHLADRWMIENVRDNLRDWHALCISRFAMQLCSIFSFVLCSLPLFVSTIDTYDLISLIYYPTCDIIQRSQTLTMERVDETHTKHKQVDDEQPVDDIQESV